MANFLYPEPYKDVSAQELLLEREVTKQGWMKKKSGREKLTLSKSGNYDKRYFVILKGWVYYYKDDKSDTPQGSFSLQGYSNRVNQADEEYCSSLPYVFKVFPKAKGERTWFFAPDTKEELLNWREAFKYEIEKYNITAGNLASSVSMPERLRPRNRTEPPLPDPRSHSLNGWLERPIRKAGKSSVASSHSTSSGGSISSFHGGDIDNYPENFSEYYESFDNNDPAPTRPYNGFLLGRSNYPLLPRKDDDVDGNYQVIDDDGPLHKAYPGSPPPRSNTSHLPGQKLKLGRIDSFPDVPPPRPPVDAPQDDYEEPLIKNQLHKPRHFSYADKPLPPLPPEAADDVGSPVKNRLNSHPASPTNNCTSMDPTESYADVQEENLSVFYNDTANELDPEATYDDTENDNEPYIDTFAEIPKNECPSPFIDSPTLRKPQTTSPPLTPLKPKALKPPVPSSKPGSLVKPSNSKPSRSQPGFASPNKGSPNNCAKPCPAQKPLLPPVKPTLLANTSNSKSSPPSKNPDDAVKRHLKSSPPPPALKPFLHKAKESEKPTPVLSKSNNSNKPAVMRKPSKITVDESEKTETNSAACNVLAKAKLFDNTNLIMGTPNTKPMVAKKPIIHR